VSVNAFLNCAIRMSLRLFAIPQRKNSATVSTIAGKYFLSAVVPLMIHS
jgi:hypothetical protein